MIHKMPEISQESFALTQSLMQDIIPRIKAISRQRSEALNAARQSGE